MASGQTMSISSLCLEPPHAFLRVHGVDPPPHGGHGVDPPPHGGHGVDPPPHSSPGSHGVDLPPCVSSRPQRHRSASVRLPLMVARSAPLTGRASGLPLPSLASPSAAQSARILCRSAAAASAGLEMLTLLHSAVAAARLRSCAADPRTRRRPSPR